MTNEEIQAAIDAITTQVQNAAIDAADAIRKLGNAGDGLTTLRAEFDTPIPPPTEPPKPPATILPRFGGAPGFEIELLSLAALNTELDHWANIGCQILRYDILDRSDYIAIAKNIMGACEQRNIKTILCVQGTSGPVGATSAAEKGKRFAAMFGPRVSVYEWVNEPNLGSQSGVSRYSGAQYGPELAAFYGGVKSQGNYLVANGGMGIWAGTGPSHPSQWWPAAMNNGARDHYDLGNGHAYDSVNAGQWTTITSLDFQGKPLIITEAGMQPSQQAVGIPQQLLDPRAICVCTFSMQEGTWKILGNPGYQAYKGVPKS